MDGNVIALSCPAGSHQWGKAERAELTEVSEWVERSTCIRCPAKLEVYFDNGEEASRSIYQV